MYPYGMSSTMSCPKCQQDTNLPPSLFKEVGDEYPGELGDPIWEEGLTVTCKCGQHLKVEVDDTSFTAYLVEVD